MKNGKTRSEKKKRIESGTINVDPRQDDGWLCSWSLRRCITPARNNEDASSMPEEQ